MAAREQISALTRRLRSRLELGEFGVPALLSGSFSILGAVDATQGALVNLPVVAIILLALGLLLIPLSPWVTVAATAVAGLILIVGQSTFLGMGSVLLPVVVTYFVARRNLIPAIVLAIELFTVYCGPALYLGYSTEVIISSVVFWGVVLSMALVAGLLIRFLLDREKLVEKRNQRALDELSRQLSRDLHDSVGGVLTRVSLLAQQARASSCEKAHENLDLIVAEAHTASSEVRLLLSRLRDVDVLMRKTSPDEGRESVAAPASPPVKQSAGAKHGDPVVTHGPMTIRQLLKSYSDRLRVYGFAVESSLDPRAVDTLERYPSLLSRLMDESVLNTIKYAAPNEPVYAVVSLGGNTVRVVLRNTESPEGNPNPADSSGIGLSSLATDIEAVGGILTTGRLTPPVIDDSETAESQWQLCVELPISPAGPAPAQTEVAK